MEFRPDPNRTARRGHNPPCLLIRWAVFALLLDAAAILHGLMVVWIVVDYHRLAEYWDAILAGSNPNTTLESIWDSQFGPMLFVAIAWAVAVTAASLAWMSILTAPHLPRGRITHPYSP